MKRVAIFAHFDLNNKIEDYIVYFLKELKKETSIIIFVSDCNLNQKELSKIKDLADYSIIEKHGEYDFGSYKKGFIYAKENLLLNNCNELIFVNDSCYAPIYPFCNMFEKMSNKTNIDFWGCTANRNPHFGFVNHVQSYFIVFKEQVFNSKDFNNFIYSITKQRCKKDIIAKYEIGLSKYLEEVGFKWDVYCNLSKQFRDSQAIFFNKLVKYDKTPFVKKNIDFMPKFYIYMLKNVLKKYTKYNTNLINIQGNTSFCLRQSITDFIKIIQYCIKYLYLQDKNHEN